MREIVSEIEGLFLRDCGEDLSASDKESLHVAVRIAADFYAYLQDKAQDRYALWVAFAAVLNYTIWRLNMGGG